ncbi:MAG: DMT family protein [Saprospiraceae bacterium]|nr:DMT family protein [Saprospiraceae bacterium]
MAKSIWTIILLFASNVFMTFAWYGHLKYKNLSGKLENWGLIGIILVSWGIAFFEYCLMVPANRLGSKEMGGRFSLTELKVIQEAISLTVFMIFVLVFFKQESLRWNHFVGFGFIILAVYFIFK